MSTYNNTKAVLSQPNNNSSRCGIKMRLLDQLEQEDEKWWQDLQKKGKLSGCHALSQHKKRKHLHTTVDEATRTKIDKLKSELDAANKRADKMERLMKEAIVTMTNLMTG